MASFSWYEWLRNVSKNGLSVHSTRRKRRTRQLGLERVGVEFLENRTLLSNTSLVQDINSISDGSLDVQGGPGLSAELNGSLYFMADDGVHGSELWKSDGTPGDTSMVADLTPGPDGSVISNLTEADGKLFFAFDDGIHDTELWSTDGTDAGTSMVLDINPEGSGIDTGDPFVNVNGELFFVANDTDHGDELWVSDGTANGTTMVTDLTPGTDDSGVGLSSTFSDMVDFESQLYFVFDDGVHGSELWKSDGSAQGTSMVSDINPEGDGVFPGVSQLTVAGTTLYFLGGDGVHGQELWALNGQNGATSMVDDLTPEPATPDPENPELNASSDLHDLTAVGNTLYFVFDDGEHGSELWSSDGTAEGTDLVDDINPEGDGVDPTSASLTDVNGTLYFLADDLVHGQELWTSNGTASGTAMVVDLTPDEAIPGLGNSSYPAGLTAVGSTLYFAFDDGVHDTELWKSNGTAAGTGIVDDINPVGSGIDPQGVGFGGLMADVDGRLFFTADDSVHGPELWTTNGTAAGTGMAADINQITNDSFDPTFGPLAERANVNGTLFFVADDGIHGSELWKSDGTDGGTSLVADLTVAPDYSDLPDSESGSPLFDLTASGSSLFFIFDDGVHGSELWTSDGTAAGTEMVKDINPDAGAFDNSFGGLIDVDGTLYFEADDGTHGLELWKSNGTANGTTMVVDLSPGQSDSEVPNSSDLSDLTAVGSQLFFVFDDGVHGSELWHSDGTAAGTTMVLDINLEGDGVLPGASLTNVAGTLLFMADDGVHGEELWRTDGTAAQTIMVADLTPGAEDSEAGNSSYLQDLTGTADGRLYFVFDDGVHGSELWMSDGTPQGTTMVDDISQDGDGVDPNDASLTDVNGELYFLASDDEHGRELWKTDGSQEGTVMVDDLTVDPTGAGFPYSSDLSDLTAAGGRLYFSFDDATHGMELWSSDGTAEGTQLVRDINPDGDGLVASPAGFGSTSMVAVNDSLFFAANDGTHGFELWKDVAHINAAPEFTKGANQTVAAGSGPVTVHGWATGISPGADPEPGETVDEFLITTSNNDSFDAGPEVDPVTGDLTFTLAASAVGTTTITIRAHDNGGTANGGVDTSAPQTFTITVTPPVDRPLQASPAPANPTHVAQGVAKAIDPTLSVSDPDGPVDFSGGKLTVDLAGTGTKSDTLTLPKSFSGLALKGKNLVQGKTVIGVVTVGKAGAPLQITFNTGATQAIVNNILSHLTFTTKKNKKVPTGARTVHLNLHNANNGEHVDITRQITIG